MKSEVNRETLRQLVRAGGTGPCVSLFIPLDDEGVEREHGRIHLKNQLKQAEGLLAERGRAAGEVDTLLEPIRAIDIPQDSAADTVVVFRSPDLFEVLVLPTRLPAQVVVGDRFQVKPLLPLANGEQPFRLLALSQNRVRVYSGNRATLTELDVPGLPESLEQALNDDDPENPLQLHTGAVAGSERPAVFHGQALGQEETKERIWRFCQMVDNAIVDHFVHQDVPLVLAAAEPVPGIYRQVNHYANLCEETIPGDPRQAHEQTLHRQAWAIVAPRSQTARAAALETLHEALAKQRATTELPATVRAAFEGRVAMVFVDVNDDHWGQLDPTDASITPTTSDNQLAEELVNRAVSDTLQHGGDAFAVEQPSLPAATSIAAVYRD